MPTGRAEGAPTMAAGADERNDAAGLPTMAAGADGTNDAEGHHGCRCPTMAADATAADNNNGSSSSSSSSNDETMPTGRPDAEERSP